MQLLIRKNCSACLKTIFYLRSSSIVTFVFYGRINSMLFGRRSKEKPSGKKAEQEGHEPVQIEHPYQRTRRVMDELCRAAQQTDEKSKEERLRKRIEFLDTTRAIPLDPRLYALWLYWHIIDGGEITHQEEYSFPKSEYEPGDKNYYTQPIGWVPGENVQNPTVPISYDPDALTIMHFSDLNTIKAAPEQRLGHTTLLTLCIHPSESDRLQALTNRPDQVRSYSDTSDILAGIAGISLDESTEKVIKYIRERREELHKLSLRRLSR